MDASQYLDAVCECAESAGKIVLDYYLKNEYSIVNKSDNTPQTEADWQAHLHILDKLKQLSPFPIISEETYKEGEKIPSAPLWLVDPIDGTKEFIRKTGDFTVNIALVDGKYPILGVIYVPTTGELFYATKSHGAFKKVKGKSTRIHTRKLGDELHILVSKNNPDITERIQEKWPNCKITRMGSSLKYCRIAEGFADVYVRHMYTYEWDTAAAQCILEEAGGFLSDFSGVRLSYLKDNLTNNSIIATGDPSIDVLKYT